MPPWELPPPDEWWPPAWTAADALESCAQDGWDPVELGWVPDAVPAPPARVEGDDGPAEVRAGRRLMTGVLAAHHDAAAAQARLVVAVASMVALYAAPCVEVLSAGARALDDEVRAGAAGQVAEEVGAALVLTDYSAHQLVERAALLVERLPATLAALASGDLDWRRAGIIADATSTLPEAAAAEVDRRLSGPAGSGLNLTSGQLPGEVDRVLHDVDRAAVIERSRRRAAGRRVGCRDIGDGMAELVATGPAPAVHAIAAAVQVLGQQSRTAAREGRGTGDPCAVPGVDDGKDRRGIDAHRFDGLQAALDAAAASPSCGAPVPVELQVHLSTLLGADDEPGHLSGHGPVPAWMVRAAMRHARLRRLLSDPLTGQLAAVDGHTYPPGWLAGTETGGGDDDLGGTPGDAPGDGPGGPGGPGAGPSGGRSRAGSGAASDCAPVDTSACPVSTVGGGTYRIPAASARLARRRWGRCTAPRCRRTAARCDVDHVVRHPDGPTCPCNLAPLCRRHHLMKHGTPRDGDRSAAARWARRAGTSRRRWRVHRCRSGHQHWTSPLGRHYVVAPEVGLTGAPPRRRQGPTALEPLCYPRQRPSALLRREPAPHSAGAVVDPISRVFDAYPAEPPF